MKTRHCFNKGLEKMHKPKNIDPEFYNWMKENTTMYGALIQPAIAAKLLNKSKGRISQMMKAGKLKYWEYENIRFLSYHEVMEIATKEVYIYMEEEMKRELNKVQKKLPLEILNTLTELSQSILDFNPTKK